MSGSKILRSTKFIGARIRHAIKLSGKSQKELASEIGVTDTWLSGVINGRQNPSLETIEKVSTVLGQPMIYFFPPYSLEDSDDPERELAVSIFDDLMELSLHYLQAIKVLTKAMSEGLKNKK